MNQLISSVYNYYDIKDDYKKVVPIPKFKGVYTNYSKYDNTYNINQINVYNIMRQFYFRNADYYIYKYAYSSEKQEINVLILKYDFVYDVLYDQNNIMYSYNKR